MEYNSRRGMLQTIFASSEPQRSTMLSVTFRELKELSIDSESVYEVLSVISDEAFPSESIAPSSAKWSSSIKASVNAGLFESLMHIIAVPWNETLATESGASRLVHGYMCQWQAWNIAVQVSSSGNIHELRSALDKLTKLKVVDISLKTLSHRFLMFRGVAVRMISMLCSASLLSPRIQPQDAGILLSALCTLALQDSEATLDLLIDPRTEWQWRLARLYPEDPWSKNRESRRLMARRIFGEIRSNSMDAARVILAMNPNSSPRTRLEIIRHSPALFDLLLDCCILERLHGYPDGATASLACAALCDFFRWPSDAIPGVPHPAELKALGVKDAKAMGQYTQVFVSQPDWTDRLTQVWINSVPDPKETEKWTRSFHAARALYGKSRAPFTQDLRESFSQTAGHCRICILRIIAMLTYNADAAGLKNSDIYSLLAIAYQGSLKIGKEPHRSGDIREWPAWVELQDKNDKYIAPFHVSPERVLGPIAFARLLVVLAQRNALNGIQFLQKTPDGISSTSLSQIQQMTHPDVIRRFLKISVGRIRSRLDEAYEWRDNGVGGAPAITLANLAFSDAAELAAALVIFDDITGGAYAQAAPRVRYLLAACLGHASHTALELKQYQRAYFCSLAALSINEKSARAEQIPNERVKFYTRTLQEAKKALGL
ncbi:hypothetical protein CONPUDRAFT_165864 [Coniophora puteana RWD-64-598 SS2]|uniref:Uncharacterized protein n=1 Tax=Coniophora puteana (strain RWD-64-598) TaxID=741705 RepID=A0A5M3MMN2_CONPW|nr:uncharacterized protein CONPUDRAFT_165864 [Coniophora puteana RWD-64-598 SS2]EIW80296.1 hypothetical protein CONPUDRAFT_165864 [Coniophora puteana RWD-64-598 SS2]